jgi:hypothetical protein
MGVTAFFMPGFRQKKSRGDISHVSVLFLACLLSFSKLALCGAEKRRRRRRYAGGYAGAYDV